MADSELTKMLQERLNKRADNAAGWHTKPAAPETPVAEETPETTEVETEVTETPATPETPEKPAEVTPPATPVSIKDVLAKQGLAVEGQTDEDLGKQLVNVLAEREELRRQQEELRRQLAEVQQKAPEPKAPVAPEVPATPEQKIKKWNKVDIDQSLVRFCEYDDKTEKFLPDPKYGAEGQAAAKELNQSVAEQKRRSQLLVNDPQAAFEEAGIFAELDSRYENKFKSWQQQFVQSLQEKQQQALANRQLQQQQQEVDTFYKSIEKEIFKVDANGKPLTGLDGGQVPTDRGLMLREKVQQLCADLDVAEPDIRIWKAAYKQLPPVEPPKAPEPEVKKQEAKEKKTQFVEQARKKPEKKPLSVPAAFNQPMPEQGGNRKQSFKDMLVKDPENAEILGTFYEGA